MPEQARPIIAFDRVRFSYGTVPVLEEATFAVYPREAICIVGPNGGGKTTLLKLILGVLRPSEGTIHVFGQSPHDARQKIGYMPQHLLYDPQFPATVLDVVLMGRLGQPGWRGQLGWRSAEDRAAAWEALRQVGVEDFARRQFASLSGGQRQRTLIARALCGDPALLLLDEPTSNVDTLVENQMLDLLRKLNEKMAVVMVSHDLGFVSNLVEKVICVNRQVVVHPTQQLTGENIHDIYGQHVRLVEHGHKHG